MTARALVGNAADAEQVKEAAKKARRTDTQRDSDLRDLIASPFGERVLWWLFDSVTTVLPTTVFVGDAHGMAFDAGRRQVGLDLLAALMQADPTAFARMQLNAITREARNG